MIKKRDFFVYGNYVGRLIGVGRLGSGVLTVSWLHIPKDQPVPSLNLVMREKLDPIPKAVAYDLAKVLKRNELG